MLVQSVMEPSTALSFQSDRVYGVAGRLLALRLRFRANCGALQQALRILTDDDYVARYYEPLPPAGEDFLASLQGHEFPREFGRYFSSSAALGRCIAGILNAWRESDYLMREVGSDFEDPIFATWANARFALTGYLDAIGRGDFLVAMLLDCHNGLRDRVDETPAELDAYLKQLRGWADI